MKTPEIIYLQTCAECRNHELCPKECEDCNFKDLVDNTTWCVDRIFDTDREYISVDALMEWLDRKYAIARQLCNDIDDSVYWGQRNALLQVIEKIKSYGNDD